MSISSLQQSFNAGEISPELYGEVSLAKYGSAATTMRNGIVNYRGGFMSRGGLAFVGRCKQSTSLSPPRAITFQFSITQGYVLEFGDQYIRFVYRGGYVVENAVAITGATNANPCQISVTGTPYANGDWVLLSGVGGMTQLNGNTYIVAGVGAGHFTLQDLNGNAVDSTAYGAYTSGGSAFRLYTVVSPYAAIDLPYLKFSQSADLMTLTCSNPDTGTEYPPYELVRHAATDWVLTACNFDPAITAPTAVSASANSQAPISGGVTNGINATFAYQVTAVDKNGNESVASSTATCHGADLEVEGGTNTITWAFVSGAKYYNVYRAPPAVDNNKAPQTVPAGSIFGFVGSAYGTQFLDTASVADLSQVPPVHANPFARGQILSVDITGGGSGLSGVTYAITTGTGSGFVGYPAVAGGALGAFPITNPGKLYLAGDSIAFNGAGYASGAIDFGAANPADGDTITLNSVVWTFKTTVAAGNQTKIQGSLADTLNQLVSDLSASSNHFLTVASYAANGTGAILLITYNTAGVGGNAYTLAASVATPSGATLTGGGGYSGTAPTATLNIGPETGTYPGVTAYFQQRRFFANSLNNPDTFWASQPGRYSDFDTRVPTIASDAITASPWTEQVNGIQWLVPMPGGLIAMTGRRAWQIVGEGSYAQSPQPITPSSTQAQPQAFNGCSATIQPIPVDYDILYVEAVSQSVVRDLNYNFFVNIYTGADLTILSSHLFRQKLKNWAWANSPYKVLWAYKDDGSFLSLTYLKEQEVYGWARHDTLGLVQGVCTVTEPPTDAAYFIVQRFPPYAPQGIYCMERMDDRLWDSVEDAYAVDSGVSNLMSAPDAFVYASAASGNGVTFTAGSAVFAGANIGQILRMAGGIALITANPSPTTLTGNWILAANNGAIGLPFASSGRWTVSTPVTSLKAPHLAGMTVVGLADGVPLSGLTVASDGTVTLPNPASNVKVGLSFLPQLQTPYLNDPKVQGARKLIPAATARVASSGPFQIGANQVDGAAQNPPQLAPVWNTATGMTNVDMTQSGMDPAPSTYTNPSGQAVTKLWTGDLRQIVTSDWKKPGQVAIQQTLPMALEVTAVVPEILPGDVPEIQLAPQQQKAQPRAPGRWMLGAQG